MCMHKYVLCVCIYTYISYLNCVFVYIYVLPNFNFFLFKNFLNFESHKFTGSVAKIVQRDCMNTLPDFL